MCFPFTQLAEVPNSHWFWNMPPSPKLGLGPNSKPLLIVGSAVLISNWGKVAPPGKVMPTELGVNSFVVLAYARRRVKPACCSQVRLGESTTEFERENTWLPAESCWGNPSREPTAPKGLLVGLL